MIDITYQRRGNFVKFIDNLLRVENRIANEVSAEFAEYVKTHKLSGQVLGVRTGETRESVKFFKLKSGEFGVRPGSGVPGRLNYLLRFERGTKPFMAPSLQEFVASNQHLRIADRVIEGWNK